jgi:hypothetical protein
VDGRAASWSHDGQELTVEPQRPLWEDHSFEVAVSYDGVPQTVQDALGGSGFFHTDDGAVVAGQPEGAATWFPANDHPLDAASVHVSIAVPEGLEGVSNGVLEDSWTHDGWTTWEWDAEEPMATYLVTLAVGEFDLRAYEAEGVRWWDAVDPGVATPGLNPAEGPPVGEYVDAALARQPEVLAFLADTFGPYPFSAAGAIVDNTPDLGFALETQTRPVYAPVFFTDPVLAEIVVVHELAHQWYGDSVRLAAWRDIWLNEGFATYAEWLWLEREGIAPVQQQFDDLYANAETVFAEAGPPFWSVLPGDPGAETSLLFHPAVYNRGAMTLHACGRSSATPPSGRCCGSGPTPGPARRSPPRSSSHWPRRSPDATSTTSSRPGCTPPSGRRSAERPRLEARAEPARREGDGVLSQPLAPKRSTRTSAAGMPSSRTSWLAASAKPAEPHT